MSTLLNLRRTCSVWNRSFIPQMKRKDKQVALIGPIGGGLHFLLEHDVGLTLPVLAELIRSSFDFPFSSYTFYTYYGRHRIPYQGSRASFLNFVSEFGITIKTLRLMCGLATRRIADLNLSHLRQIIFEWMPQLVELELDLTLTSSVMNGTPTDTEELELDLCSPPPTLPKLKQLKVGVQPSHQPVPIQVKYESLAGVIADAIQAANLLESLDVWDQSNQRGENSNGNLFLGPLLINLVNNTVDLGNLKTLKFTHTSLTAADFRLLLQLCQRGDKKGALRLKSFSVNIFTSFHHENDLWSILPLLGKFLAIQSPSLTDLELCFCLLYDSTQIQWVLPRVPNLRKLSFEGTLRALPDGFFQFEDTFEDNYPALELLTDNSENMLVLSEIGARAFHSGVRSLETHLTDYRMLARLRPLLPSLTRLKLELRWGCFTGSAKSSPEIFFSIWTMWPTLTVLDLHLACAIGTDPNMDEFITGVPQAGLELIRYKFDPSIRASLATLPEETSLNLLRGLRGTHKIWAGISDLKQLKEISITFDNCSSNHPQLTDMGCYFGLALASHTLQRLLIHGNGKNLVSEPCREFVKTVLGFPVTDINL